MQGQNRSRPAFRDRQEDPLTAGLHSRGYLPHLKSEGGSYFVTFRLFGTLPKELLLRLKREREIIVQEAEVAKRPLTRAEHEELFIWYSTKVDQILDEGRHGVPWLAKSRIADLVVAALRHFEGERYFLHAFAVMPNHLHVVVRPQPPNTLSAILHSWKSYSASEANKLLNRVGEHFWQKESFDHFCRNEDDLNRCVRYTLDNPVKARLCARWEDWRWSSAWRGAT